MEHFMIWRLLDGRDVVIMFQLHLCQSKNSQTDETIYQCLRPSSEMFMAKRKVFRFIVGPIAEIRTISNTALPAFTKLFYFCDDFILE